MKIRSREFAIGCVLIAAAMVGCNHDDDTAATPSDSTTKVVVTPPPATTVQTPGTVVVDDSKPGAETTHTTVTTQENSGQSATAGSAQVKPNQSSTTGAAPTATGPKTTSHLPGWPTKAASHSLPGGLQYKDLAVGKGAAAKAGDNIQMHYTGYLMDGTKFDSSVDRGTPLGFVLGVGQVVKGWDEGIVGMKVGGKRKLIIPAALAYGAQGTPGGPIPPNADLVFDTELVQIAGSSGPASGGPMDAPLTTPTSP